MSTNDDMNGWIRQAMAPKHALDAFVALLNPQGPDPNPQEAETETGNPPGGDQAPPRRRVNADAGEGQGRDAQPEVGGTANQAMNRLLREAVRNRNQS